MMPLMTCSDQPLHGSVNTVLGVFGNDLGEVVTSLCNKGSTLLALQKCALQKKKAQNKKL